MATSGMYNYALESRREGEFPQLKGAVYVDHAGATLYSKSQIDSVHRDFTENLFGNPHSHNASSKLATDTVDQIRYRLLQFFNAKPDEYSLIFTAGCTAALKTVAECFSFGTETPGVFCFLDDNHTSVQGMREAVADRTSGIFCLDEDELRVAMSHQGSGDSGTSVDALLATGESSSVDPSSLAASTRSLLAFPAQSNFSGKKYPFQWVKQVQESGLSLPGKKSGETGKWFVLLDAAAFVSTNRLNLAEIKPDFLGISFYKMFGYPTGLGALIVHKRAWPLLIKKYYGGGTVAMSTAKERFHAFREALHDRFEDGTLPYLGIISLRHGLDALNKLAGGMDRLSEHVFCVAEYFHHHLSNLRHGNGQPLAEIYGGNGFESPKGQGGIVTFNLKRADGKYIGYAENGPEMDVLDLYVFFLKYLGGVTDGLPLDNLVEPELKRMEKVDKFAQLHDVHLRTGCFCNIGACQRYLNLSSKLIKDNFAAGHVCGDNMDLINGLPTGAVRISFGYMSTINDARTCLRFIADTFLEQTGAVPAFPDPSWYRKPSENAGKTEICAKIPRERLHNHGMPNSVIEGEVSADTISVTCSETVRKVTDIFLFPIKSCGAFRVCNWEMSSKGLLYDREWILVSDTGVTIGQKREPKICLLRPVIDLERRKLVLTFPETIPFVLPLDQEEDSEAMASLCTNKVCGDRVNTYDCGDAVSDWLSRAIGISGVRLLRQQSEDTRRSRLKDKENINTNSEGPEKPRLSMANESQLLLLSRASVQELQKKMVEIVDTTDADDTRMPTAPANITEDNLMRRFRGNLVIDGGKPFDEDSWSSIQVGKHTVVCQGPCTRCQMICMDQETGEKSREPLRTLGVWRGKKVPFGVYARMLPPTDGSRQFLRIGDEVIIS